jgi:thiamine biosynthesis protein ThiS
MITLTINGRERTLAAEMTVSRFLEESGIDARIIAVEHNGAALRREQFPEVVLRHADSVEIVRMIGGG